MNDDWSATIAGYFHSVLMFASIETIYNYKNKQMFVSAKGDTMQNNYETRYIEMGKRIAFYREKRGLSQTELAQRVKCTPIYIRKVEGEIVAVQTSISGIWEVKKLDFLFAIADALQMDILAFFKPMTEENFLKYRRDN